MGKKETVEFLEDLTDSPFRAVVRPIWNGFFATENNVAMLCWAALFVMTATVLFGSKWIMQPFGSVLIFFGWMTLFFVPLYQSLDQQRVRSWSFSLFSLAGAVCVSASVWQTETPVAAYLGTLAAFSLGKRLRPQFAWRALALSLLMGSLLSWAVANNFTDWSRTGDVIFWLVCMLAVLILVAFL